MTRPLSILVGMLALACSSVNAADPILSDGRMTPYAGFANNTYTFYVTYSDADGDPANPGDEQVPELYLNDLDPVKMTRVSSGIPDWTQPVLFQAQVVNGALNGQPGALKVGPMDVNQFYFVSGTTRLPVDPGTFNGPVINYAPVLFGGSSSLSVPGLRGANANYSVTYRDINGDAPEPGFPIAWLGNSIGWQFRGGIVSRTHHEVTLITDSTKSWTPSQFKDQPLNYFTGGRVGLTDTILDNTTNTLIILGQVDNNPAEKALVGDKFKINESAGTITSIDYRAAVFVDSNQQYTPGSLIGERLQLVSNVGSAPGVIGRVYQIAGNTAQFIALSGQVWPTVEPDPAFEANGVKSGVAYSIHDVLVGTVTDFNLDDDGFVTLKIDNDPGWLPDQFAGLVLYVLEGDISSQGNSYQIWSNSSDKIVLAESKNDMVAANLKNGDLVRVAGVSMKVPDLATNLDFAGPTGVWCSNTTRGFADRPSVLPVVHTVNWMVSNSIEGFDERYTSQARYPVTTLLEAPTITNTLPSPNYAPELRNASASPLKGTVSTNFNFAIEYKDKDGDAPGPHDGVVGNVTLFLEAPNGTRVFRASTDFGGGAWPIDLWRKIDSVWSPGFQIAAGTLPAGNYRYHFEASDGWRTTRFPSNPENDPAIVVNSKPTLANPSVTPSTGNTGTSYRFRVTYTDSDNAAPSSIHVVLDGVPSALGKEDPADNNFIDGVVYYIDKSGLTTGSHSFKFTASDDIEAATDTATIVGPSVRAGNTAPLLSAGGVTPLSSKLDGNSFNYSVYYFDADGDAPNSVTVTIYGTDGTTVLDTRAMALANPGSPNYGSAGGVLFVSNGYSFAGSGRYFYKFSATDGLLTASGDNALKSGPAVNTLPVLWLGAVDPLSGPSSQLFTYSVKYTDVDNVGPSASGYARVAITLNGVTTKYALAPQTSTGWNTGVIYSRQIQLTPGVYSYHFEANDGLDNAVSTPEVAGPTSIAASELRNASVTPASGKSTDTYSYTVTFANPDNTAPDEIKVFIDGSSAINGFDLTKIIPTDINYMTGVQYRFQTTLVPGEHTWFIRAKVGGLTLYPAGQSQVAPASGPSVNNPPVIVGATVDPTFGRTTTNFVYSVLYTDADGVAPGVNGYVRIRVPGIADPINLIAQGSTWASGVTYQGTSYLPGGAQSFYVEASDGIEESRLPAGAGAFDGPRVSSAPTLTNGAVSPTSGGSTTLFTYTITYSDADNDAPITNGVKVLIDGQPFTMTKVNPSDVDYTDGAIYTYSAQLIAGSVHNYKFQASDGIDLVSTSLVTNSPVVNASSITLNATPNPVQLGNSVTFTGQLLPSSAQQVSLTLTKPSGATVYRTVASSAGGMFNLDATADEVGEWVIRASVPAGSVALNPPLVVVPASIRVGGGIVDMISSPVTTITGDPASIFGLTQANSMRIVRWDPFLAAYQYYGSSPSFAVLRAGSGFWIKPTTTMTVALSGSLSDQTREIVTAVLPGWNQIGSGFVRPVSWGTVKIRYQGQTVTLAQAAANGWAKDYAWGYDSLTKSYFLVRAAGGTSSVLDPYRGYWFSSNVACELLVQPPVEQ